MTYKITLNELKALESCIHKGLQCNLQFFILYTPKVTRTWYFKTEA